MPTIKDLGEKKLLQWLQTFCQADSVGDDGALVHLDPFQDLVITTDVLVDGVHFSEQTTGPFEVGYRSAGANLSDLAAMGATPLGLTVGLSLPPELSLDWLEKLYQGINALNTPIIGGDLTRSSVITIGITAIGQVPPSRVIKRSNAKVGDLIVVTGWHGLSRGGLELLLNPALSKRLEPDVVKSLIDAHQRPRPRLDVIDVLWSIPQLDRVAGMDSSDGLADAIVQICNSSKVGAQIDSLSCPAQLQGWLSQKDALDWILYGGEDFELVLTMAKPFAEKLVSQLGPPAAIIGQITQNQEIYLVGDNSSLDLCKGFQHF